MSLKFNGVEPKVIKVDDNGTVTDVKKVYVIKNGERNSCWIKPYALTISKGSHSNVIVEYKTTEHSNGVEINSGEMIYPGGYLEITVTGHQGYTVSWQLNGATQSLSNVLVQVTGNVSIVVTETANTVSLNKPVISGSYSYDSYIGCYYLSCQITNTNSSAVTANILVYADGDILEGTFTRSISANSTVTYNHGEVYSNGARVCVTFSSAGFGDSSGFATFGNYTGSAGATDETTTTTTS